MGLFKERLNRLAPTGNKRRWVFVSNDQLSDSMGPLSSEDPASLGVILIENVWQANKRPYHKQKLACLWANMRHFALEQAGRGVAVRYLTVDEPFSTAVGSLVDELGLIRLMRPAERELRLDLEPLVQEGLIEILPHEGWLTTRRQFELSQNENPPPWRMDAFYRFVRRDKNILMEEGKPTGGKFSFDAENRLPWCGEPPAPDLPSFQPDSITKEVGDLIEDSFLDHPGNLDLEALPATKEDAQNVWMWAQEKCMEHFGPYEDAMSSQSTNLFHTRVSSLLNLSRLTPQQLLEGVLSLEIPLSSKEGFVRQVLGWREFMRHVHEVTDGFRDLSRRHGKSLTEKEVSGDLVCPSFLGSDRALFPAYWGEESGLHCLDRVVSDVWREGYSHHITRLMVLSNLATLLDVSPRELTDWFWCAYTDAYDWVVEPNVLGMGSFALGNLFTTKPYVSGSAYINKMSDYCSSCLFSPNTNCPITSLYWAFLERHQDQLKDNPRMRIVFASLRKRPSEKRRRDQLVFEVVQEKLSVGASLSAEDFPS